MATFYAGDSLRVYHVHSDSIFDFRPRWDDHLRTQAKFTRSHLEHLLDILITGTEADVEKLKTHLENRPESEEGEISSARADSKPKQFTAVLTLNPAGLHCRNRGLQRYQVPILLAGLRALCLAESRCIG